MNYDSLIKRVKKAIEIAKNKEAGSSVHILNIDDPIEELNGLIIILHPNFNDPRDNTNHAV